MPQPSLAEKHKTAILDARKAAHIKRIKHPDFQGHVAMLRQLPTKKNTGLSIDQEAISIHNGETHTPEELETLTSAIQLFSPWAKGPFRFFGIPIESQWNCALKINKCLPQLGNIENKIIADIGCNNGWYMYRLLPFKPKQIVGFEIQTKFWYQFQLFNHYLKVPNIVYENYGFDMMALYPGYFDIVLCLGLYYHVSDPFFLLRTIYNALSPGGLLILEGELLDFEQDLPLAMHSPWEANKWIPNSQCVLSWLEDIGFSDPEYFFKDTSTLLEEWSQESVNDYAKKSPLVDRLYLMDPDDSTKDVKGLPLSYRGFFKAHKPI